MSAVASDAGLQRAFALVAAVPDPEIPVVNLHELGILRGVERRDGRLVVTLTPTYTGCPATQAIRDQVRDTLAAGGFADADVRIELSPPWTTDWITDDGRRKLREYGIAPPAHSASELPTEAVLRFVPNAGARVRAAAAPTPDCPRCGSTRVERLSEYGSTPCKALYRCVACREPFDYFKPY